MGFTTSQEANVKFKKVKMATTIKAIFEIVE